MISKWELPALALAVFVLAFFLLRQNAGTGGDTAHININGQTVKVISLNSAKDGVFSMREQFGVPVDFKIKDGKIRFVNVECPDHICERTGFIGKDGQVAVCMPNKTSVTITN